MGNTRIKRTISILLVCVSLLFAACGTDNTALVQASAQPTAQPTEQPTAQESVSGDNAESTYSRDESENKENEDAIELTLSFTAREFIDEFSARMAYMKSSDKDGIFDVSVPTANDFELEQTKKRLWEYNDDGGTLDYSVSVATEKADDIDSYVTFISVDSAYNSGENSFFNTLLMYSCLFDTIDHELGDGGAQIVADLLNSIKENNLGFSSVTKNGVKYLLSVWPDKLSLFCSIDEEAGDLQENTTKQSESNPKNVNWYNADIYKVGVDLAAGEYYLVPTSTTTSAYMAVCSDSNGDDILENDNFDGPTYITVEDGQYFEVTRAKFALASEISTSFDPSNLKEGMYLVGKDIPAGEYLLKANSDRSAYVCVYDNSTVSRNIVTNDNFDGKKYITVRDGEYLEIVRCTGALL